MSSRLRLAAVLLCVVTFLSAPRGHAARHGVETQDFTVEPGDVLIVDNDYGRVRVRTWSQPQIHVQIRKIAADESRLDEMVVVSEKKGDRIFIHSYFYDYRAESVYLDIQAPPFINLVVGGANAAVEISGVAGYVRAHTLTGLITVENLPASVSLLSEQGDIFLRSRIQPQGDIRMESVQGDILCEFFPSLNLRGWARAGGTLSWDREIQLQNGSLEKQLGVGGALALRRQPFGRCRISIHPLPGFTPRACRRFPPDRFHPSTQASSRGGGNGFAFRDRPSSSRRHPSTFWGSEKSG